MCYSILSMEILLILRYQHINRLFQTRDCKGGHIKMMAIVKSGFFFTAQLANAVIIL